ncbi:MAG: hypothetical protein GXP47_05895 [Acidobacteria bacterium]|nr:hypothetical protein [Acidobacteriota bacterium]
MAAEIQRELGVTPRLVKGKGGVFDVVVDGRLVFSKHQLHRFPDPGEVVRRIREMDESG